MTQFRPGDLLISPPAMADPRFKQTVILLTQDTNQGSQGLCINRPSGHTVNEIIKPIEISLEQDIPLYWGGPVGVNTVWMLHDPAWTADNTLRIGTHWSMTSSMNMFHKIVDGDRPKWFRVMIGLSSWAPGQLEMEMGGEGPWTIDSSWIVARAPGPEDLFTIPPRDLWNHCCELAGTQAVNTWLV